jgi:hypothetical protein
MEPEELHVPETSAPMREIWQFALTYNGYDRHGGSPGAAAIGNDAAARWADTGELPEDLATARCALFFEQRRYRHFGTDPQGTKATYIHSLVGRIGDLSGGRVAGPSDPLP